MENRNALIYDPYLGKFLSADPVLPDAGDMQAFNRYSYVVNNPFKYTDQTGNVYDGCTASCFVIASFVRTAVSIIFGGSDSLPAYSCPFEQCQFAQLFFGDGFSSFYNIINFDSAWDHCGDVEGGCDFSDLLPENCDPGINPDCGSGNAAPSTPAGGNDKGGVTVNGPSVTISIPIGNDGDIDLQIQIGGIVEKTGRGRNCDSRVCFTGPDSQNTVKLNYWKSILARYLSTNEGQKMFADYFTGPGSEDYQVTIQLGATATRRDGSHSAAGSGLIVIDTSASNPLSPFSRVFRGEGSTFVGSDFRTFAHEAAHALPQDRNSNAYHFSHIIPSANRAVYQDAMNRGVPERAEVRIGLNGIFRRTASADSNAEFLD